MTPRLLMALFATMVPVVGQAQTQQSVLDAVEFRQRTIADPQRGLQLIPEAVSDYAGQVDQLYLALLALSGLLILTLVGLVAVFGFRYRFRQAKRRKPLLSKKTGHRLEIGFAVTLGIAFLGLFVWAGKLYLDLHAEPRDALVINVIGKQWMWKIQHPDGTREINTLHVPVDEPVLLRLTSQDVIHSFSLPALRLKRDALPGTYTRVRFRAERTGEYRLFCAEFCGLDHSRMRGKLVVMTPEDYQAWLDGQGGGPSPAVLGRRLFGEHGCGGCHELGAGERAPDLAGVFGREVRLSGGDTVTADEAYLRTAVLRPQQQVVAGYQPIMPSLEGQLSEEEVLNLIAYLKTLESDPASGTEDGP